MSDAPTDILHLERNLEWQEKEWKFQRIGWSVVFAVIILGALGTFGGAGLLVEARQQAQGSLPFELKYDHFGRYLAPTALYIRPQFSKPAPFTKLWIDADYLADMHIEEVMPQPHAVTGDQEKLVYTFNGTPRLIRFRLTPQHIGMKHGHIGMAGGASLPFRHFIYP